MCIRDRCFICEEELPAFRSVERDLDGDVDFIFVNSNETGDWRPMAQRTGITNGGTLARDVEGLNRNGLYRSLGGTGAMPITAFYDADGTLVETIMAPFDESQLYASLRPSDLARRPSQRFAVPCSRKDLECLTFGFANRTFVRYNDFHGDGDCNITTGVC